MKTLRKNKEPNECKHKRTDISCFCTATHCVYLNSKKKNKLNTIKINNIQHILATRATFTTFPNKCQLATKLPMTTATKK